MTRPRGSPYRLLAVVVLTVYLWACGGESEAPHRPGSPLEVDYKGVIVAMGDSLTEGLGVDESLAYPAQLQQRLIADGFPYAVINAGISGETSSGARARLDWVMTLEPDIVILETGANDGLRGIDPDITRANIGAIVSRMNAEGVVVVLAGMKMFRNLGTSYVREFEAIYPEVAQENGLILIPFFLEEVAADPSVNQSDGIHPTAEGYSRVVAIVYPHVREAIERFEGIDSAG